MQIVERSHEPAGETVGEPVGVLAAVPSGLSGEVLRGEGLSGEVLSGVRSAIRRR